MEIGTLVALVNDAGNELLVGTLEYVTPDGWGGVRQDGGGIDEMPLESLVVCDW